METARESSVGKPAQKPRSQSGKLGGMIGENRGRFCRKNARIAGSGNLSGQFCVHIRNQALIFLQGTVQVLSRQMPQQYVSRQGNHAEQNQQRNDSHKYEGADKAIAHPPEETVFQIAEDESKSDWQ